MKCSFESPGILFARMFVENESVTRISYQIVHKMAKRRKTITDGYFIKDCKIEAENDVCPEKAALFGSIIISASSELGDNMVLQIREKVGNFLFYLLSGTG